MREPVDADRIRDFARALGSRARDEVRVYLTGGATSVLRGWRPTTIDIDLKIVPDSDPLLFALPELKKRYRVNVELASPDDFIPELSGWQDRSIFTAREGTVSFFHYDPYSQALAKLERGHDQDLRDVRRMLEEGLVEPKQLLDFFEQIEPRLYRFPAIDPRAFRRAVEAACRERLS
ncbi:MAG TPA: DUF6036 family nucleotidyltransferase [Thermoanaerobaculia bacterium]|nr:DUF6036 family nucleotidyltransferase [Thermoanaerobaculia bacterium]HTQ11031.1 DUF6036 family nucleotidyltransferase [Fimbriimonadaceae bacterium]